MRVLVICANRNKNTLPRHMLTTATKTVKTSPVKRHHVGDDVSCSPSCGCDGGADPVVPEFVEAHDK